MFDVWPVISNLNKSEFATLVYDIPGHKDAAAISNLIKSDFATLAYDIPGRKNAEAENQIWINPGSRH